MQKNILVLSCGTRNKIIRYFKKALTAENGIRIGNVVAADMSSIAPAIYEADKFYIVPRMTETGYIDVVLDICVREHISAVLSLIDPELSFLAKHVREFEAIGTTVVGSSYDLCEMSLDKMKMHEWLFGHGYNSAKSYTDKNDFYLACKLGVIKYPVFVKPVCGSASISVSKVCDKETVELLFARNDDLMIQEYLDGQEIGADVYVDLLSGEVVSIFTKKKLLMRAGETDKAVSFKDDKLFCLIKKFVKEAGYRGQIDIDFFEIDGEYYISEVNPRFGGGYPHAHECGCDHTKLIINNLFGIVNKEHIGDYEDNVFMMKYNDLSIIKL